MDKGTVLGRSLCPFWRAVAHEQRAQHQLQFIVMRHLPMRVGGVQPLHARGAAFPATSAAQRTARSTRSQTPAAQRSRQPMCWQGHGRAKRRGYRCPPHALLRAPATIRAEEVTRIVPGPSCTPGAADSVSVGARVLHSSAGPAAPRPEAGPLSASPRNKRRKRLFKAFPPSRSRAFPLILLHESNWLYWVSPCPGILRNTRPNS